MMKVYGLKESSHQRCLCGCGKIYAHHSVGPRRWFAYCGNCYTRMETRKANKTKRDAFENWDDFILRARLMKRGA